MADYGFKVSQPGYDVKTATPDQLVFSSKYQTLKISSQGSGAIKDSTGRTITIAHNLGYIPIFLVHIAPYGSPDYYISPHIPYVYNANKDVTAWADTTNLYIKAGDDYGIVKYYSEPDQYNYANEDDGGYDYGWFETGNNDGVEKGALRFPGVNTSQGTVVYKAELGIWVYERNGTDTVYTTMYGIDEDNTATFDTGTAATARAKTTASINSNYGSASDSQYFGTDVTSLVNEVLTRPGWSSGNAMGFIVDDNGTAEGGDDGNSVYTDPVYSEDCSVGCCYLKIQENDTLLNYKFTIYSNKVI